MVRIRIPAVAAAAVVALAACSSIDGVYPSALGGAGAPSHDLLFPPPPPIPAEEPSATSAGVAEWEFQALAAALKRLAADIEEGRRDLAALEGEVERLRCKIGRLLAAQAGEGKPSSSFAPAPAEPADRRPLVRIRYDRPAVEYADALRAAVEMAVERLPDPAFDLIAVAPAGAATSSGQGAAHRRAEEVVAALLKIGIGTARLSLSSTIDERASSPEVRLYIR